MASEVGTSYPVSGVNPFSQNQVTQGRTYGNQADLSGAIRQLFGEMPHLKEVTAYENTTQTDHSLPYYFIGKSAYIEERVKGLTNRSGGWMTDDVLKWAYTNQITYTWDEYHFEHTLVGRVPHKGVPRVVKSGRKTRSERSKRHGIGFVMDASELLTQRGIKQYQNNIRGIVACILETVYLNSIYALLDASERGMREHMATSVSQGGIADDFEREIMDYASIAKDPQGTVETIDRKHRLLDMIGAQRVFLITTPESGIYMSKFRTFQKPDPGYIMGGPDAQFNNKTKYYDFVIQTNNGAINVYTARDLKTGERGNFIKPLYAEPWIAEFFVQGGRIVKSWPLWDGFSPSDNCLKFKTEMRDCLIYSTQKDGDVRISFKKSSQYSAFAHEQFLKNALMRGPKGNSKSGKWEEKHFYPSHMVSTAARKMDAYDSFGRPDEDAFHRYAPSLLCWNRKLSKAQICEHFGHMDTTALSEETLRMIGDTIGANGSWKSDDLELWKVGVLELMDSIEKSPYDEAFFRDVLTYNGNVVIDNPFASSLAAGTIEQFKGASGITGVMALPPKSDAYPTLNFPSGFTGYAGLQAIAQWDERSEDSGWGNITRVANIALTKINDVVEIIERCFESEDIKEEHRPINYPKGGKDGRLAAFIQNLVYTDRSPLFLRTEPLAVSERMETSGASSSERVIASVMTQGADDLSRYAEALPSTGNTLVSSKAGMRNPIITDSESSPLVLSSAEGEEAKAIGSLRYAPSRDALVNTLKSIRSQRDKLLDAGELSEDEAVIEPLISDYLESVKGGEGDITTENHVAGIGFYVNSYMTGKGSEKEKFTKSVKLLQNIVNAAKGEAKSFKPSLRSIRGKGEAALSGKSPMKTGLSPFIVSSCSKSQCDVIKSTVARIASRNVEASAIADDIINACSSALAYSRAKWASGNDSDALLMYNPSSGEYNHAITSDTVRQLHYSANIKGEAQQDNVVASVYNYAGEDETLKNMKERVRTGMQDLAHNSRSVSTSLRPIIQGTAFESISGGFEEFDADVAVGTGNYVMTSLFLTKGIYDTVTPGRLVASGNKDTGYLSAYAEELTALKADKAFAEYNGNTLSTGRYIPVKTYEHTLLHAMEYGKSGAKQQKRKRLDRFGGTSAVGRYKRQAISGDESRRERLSSALGTTGLGSSVSPLESVSDTIGDAFDMPRFPSRSGIKTPLKYSIHGLRRGEYPMARPEVKWPAGYTGSKGVTKYLRFGDSSLRLDTSNYREHMIHASKIGNPIIRVLTMAFLSSLCLRKNGKDPWKRLEMNNILTPSAFIGIRGQIQNAMEHWIMGEPGFRLGANVYAHNQFIVGVDATSMMIYGNLGYYHKSLVYDHERVVLLPYIRPRKYICGSEDKFVTSERQLNLNGLKRPDIISLGISFEEGELDSELAILGWYKYPDMNRMMEPDRVSPGYSGHMEFRYRFPTQVSRIYSGYGQKGNRTYKDMLRRFPSVMFQGRQVNFKHDGCGMGDFSAVTPAVGHRAGGCVHGSKKVWNGKTSYFPSYVRDVSIRG